MVDNSCKSQVTLQATSFFSLEINPITGDITPLPEIDARKNGELQINNATCLQMNVACIKSR